MPTETGRYKMATRRECILVNTLPFIITKIKDISYYIYYIVVYLVVKLKN
jgi:hypothetical protein